MNSSQASAWTSIGRLLGPFLPAVVVFFLAMLWGTLSSPYFLDIPVLLLHSGRYMEIGLLALAMTLVIIHGDIDWSVASNLAFSAATLGLVYQSGAPIAVAGVVAIIVGTVLGLINGLLVTVIGLPSLVVTLGTLALYRGLAQIALGDQAVTGYPEGFVGADQNLVIGVIPLPLTIFIVMAMLVGFLVHRTSFGFVSLMLGRNQVATMFSGMQPKMNRLIAFALSGTMAGFAAVLITARLGSTRSNLALGFELLVVTIVVLGGTDIFGGKGTIAGTVLALFAVIAVREALAIQNVNGQIQDAVIGLILVLTIAVPVAVSRLLGRVKASRRKALLDFEKGRSQ